MGIFDFFKKKPENKVVKAVVPKGRPLHTFVPMKQFHSDKFQSTYLPGYVYTVREGNEELRKAALVWEKDGLIKMQKAGA